MLRATAAQLMSAPLPEAIEIPEPVAEEKSNLRIKLEDGVFIVQGHQVERRVAMTNLDNEEALFRLQQALRRFGVFAALKEAGVQAGDTVRIRDLEFDFVPDPWERESENC